MSVNYVNPTTGELTTLAGGTLYADAPIGSVLAYVGTTPPSGWLLCQGQAISRTDYADLFSVIGTTFGSGNGTTTFNIPDMREVVPVGAGYSSRDGIAAHDSYTLGQFKDDQLQGHWHGDGTTSTAQAQSQSKKGFLNILANEWEQKITNFTKNTISDNVNGEPRTGTTTHGKQLGVNYIIKVKQVSVPFDIAEYVRNQNVLSEWETITLSTSSSDPTIMHYDGFIAIKDCYSGNTGYTLVFIDGVNVIQINQYGASGTIAQSPDGMSFPVKKGQSVYLNVGSIQTAYRYAAFYKLRDYRNYT